MDELAKAIMRAEAAELLLAELRERIEVVEDRCAELEEENAELKAQLQEGQKKAKQKHEEDLAYYESKFGKAKTASRLTTNEAMRRYFKTAEEFASDMESRYEKFLADEKIRAVGAGRSAALSTVDAKLSVEKDFFNDRLHFVFSYVSPKEKQRCYIAEDVDWFGFQHRGIGAANELAHRMLVRFAEAEDLSLPPPESSVAWLADQMWKQVRRKGHV